MKYDATIFHDGKQSINPNRFSKLKPDIQAAKSKFVKRIISPDTTAIADVCCGNCYLSKYLGFKDYIGVDHPDMISLINNESICHNNSSFIPFDFEKNNGTLDIGMKVDSMVSFETIEHVSDPENFLYNLRENLKHNGLLILSTPNNPNGYQPMYGYHTKEYSLKEMSTLFKKNGFKIQGTYLIGVPFGLVLRKLKKEGIKTVRSGDPGKEKRGSLSKLVDHLPMLRELYCKILPLTAKNMRLGRTATNMILVASKS